MKLRNGKTYNLNLTFKKWMVFVDRLVLKIVQIPRTDLPDENYWVHWNNNVSVREMVQIILENNMYI